MYRFHPSIHWEKGFPDRERILDRIRALWERYNLQGKTRFDIRVEKVVEKGGQWIINGEFGPYDGVIVCVGTCGDPKMPKTTSEGEFEGKVVHSSELDGVDVANKRVAVIGGGASAIEVLEYATAHGAQGVDIIARSEKWIIPRNPFVDMLLAAKPLGLEDRFSFLVEQLLRRFFYRDLYDLSPTRKGLWESTPVVNDQVFNQIRNGQARWIRGDLERDVSDGVYVTRRARGIPKGGPGKSIHIPADVLVMATGFTRPSLRFLPDEMFPDNYSPPSWFLQTFPPGFSSVCAINSTYVNALGTVGNVHIGAYTRILLMFLLDPSTRPTEEAMKRWVDCIRWIKTGKNGSALGFFTYAELILWLLGCILVDTRRWKWFLFVFFGWGVAAGKQIK